VVVFPGSPLTSGSTMAEIVAEFSSLTGHTLPSEAMLLQVSGEDPSNGTRDPRVYTLWISPPSTFERSSLASRFKDESFMMDLSVSSVQIHYKGVDQAEVAPLAMNGRTVDVRRSFADAF
jgi:hypothetical protein